MSKTVDERVVSMQFDNRKFEQNVQTSMSTLDKLKSKLNLSGAAKGLENVDAAAKNVDMSGLSNSVEGTSTKFSALQVMAVTALATITNAAVQAGARIVSALTIDPIKTGLAEYETQINAVQTIMANTSSKGTTLDQVNSALDELNKYADLTIYNFTEMTRNIGTFTAAGVDLDTSVKAIKGIANLAAVSGSNSHQASTAMYQLSQALAAGKVQLMDWNSVVNAGMGGQVFQDALKETARAHDIAIDDMIEANGSFRETLQEGWLTSEILTETLEKFTLTTEGLTEAEIEQNREMLKSKGYTEEQIDAIFELGKTSTDAATKVKTFTQMVDTLKEVAQSGWANTWKIIIGDFEEAKTLWTNVSNTLNKILEDSGEARNEVLRGWAEGGGREMAIEAIANAFKALLSVIKPIKEAFREVFPRTTADQLLKITEQVRDFTKHLILTEKAQAKLKSTFKGLFAVVDIGVTLVKEVISGVVKLVGSLFGLSGSVFTITGSLGDMLSNLRDSIKQTGVFGTVIGGVVKVAQKLIGVVKTVIGFLAEKFAAPGFQLFGKILEGIGKVASWLGDKIGKLMSSIADAFKEGSFQNVMDLINGSIIGAILLKLKGMLGGSGGLLSGFKDLFNGFSEVLGSVGEALTAWQQNLKAGTLMKIAGAIAILAASILVISTIDSDKLATSLGTITALFAELMGAMAVFTKIAGAVKGVFSASVAMASMSTSVLILAAALKILSSIDTQDLVKSLAGLAATFAIMLSALAVMSKIGKAGKGAGKLIPIALSLVIFASALKILATMSWDDIGRSLTVMAGVFAILLSTLAVMSKIDKAGKGAASLIPMSISLVIFASSLKILGTMSWDDIGRSLTAMAGVFAILLGVMFTMSKFSTFNTGALSILTIATSLVLIGAALKIVASMDWEGIGKSLTGIGVTLALMVAALAVLSAVGPQAIIGAAAMVVMAAAINLLIPPLLILGSLSWESIIKGLAALAGTFVIIGVAGYVLAPIVPVILALAGALALVGVATLAFGVGLTAIGVGLTSLATALTVGATSIVAGSTIIIKGIIGLIPAVLTAIGQGIIAILDVIAASGKSIFNVITVIITELCNAVIKSAPKIIEAALTLLNSLLEAIVNFVPKLVDAGIRLVVGILQGIAKRLPEVIQAGINVVVAFIKGITSAIPQLVDAGYKAAIDLVNGIANSIRDNTPLVIEAMNNLLSACAEAVGMYVGNFAEAGRQIMAGFRKGIEGSIGSVKDSIVNGVTGAWNNVLNFFGIHSPSTLAAEAGKFIDEGLALGLSKYSNVAGDAATDVAKETSNSLSDALANIPNLIDADSQPVIKPVLDLSEVKSGASAISNMFGINPSVDVMSNVGAISAGMRTSQNGSGDELVSAIKDLASNMSQGNVYNINGITYDDGSNVSQAIEALIRAARVERRI